MSCSWIRGCGPAVTIGLVLVAAGCAPPASTPDAAATPEVALAARPAPEPVGRRPNVVLVVMDDLYAKIGVYGEGPATPNLDRLAARGRRFDRAYAQYALCSPSRTSLVMGWRPERTGVWNHDASPRTLARGAVPLQDHFRAHGYYTARLGKIIHRTHAHEFEWDHAQDAPEPEEDEGEDHSTFDSKIVPTDGPDEAEPDGILARGAAQLLAARGGGDQPLFLAVGFLRPHAPWRAPRRYFEMYPPEQVVLPAVPADDLADIPAVALKRGAENVPADRQAEALSAYYASVTFVDAQLGVVLDQIDRQALWDETVVIVTSDHGIQRGEHGLWRKNVLYEESTRVPLIVAAPGLQAPGEPTLALVELVDLYPTLLELAALPAPGVLDGVSLVPVLRDPRARVKDVALSVSDRGRYLSRSIRTERYRFTLWRPGVMELFDHDTDPGEHVNLADRPEQTARVEEFTSLVRRLSPRPDPLVEPKRRP